MPPHPTTCRKWLKRLTCLCLAVAWVVATETGYAAGEYQVKAAFLFNFTRFTVWPPGVFPSSNAPIVIGIVGEDSFGSTIDDAVSGEVVGGHPLVVKRLLADEDFQGCHILFFSHSEKKRLPELLKRIKGSAVLSVSEVNGFAEQGGMINLVIADKNVKIEINQAVAEQAGLRLSSKLLNLARVVLVKSRD